MPLIAPATGELMNATTGTATRFAALAAAMLGFAAMAEAQLANLPADVRDGIVALGPELNPNMIGKSFALMRPLEASRDAMKVEKNLSYGADPLQKLDLWAPANGKKRAAIIVFVHGGGFVRGDKNDYDNVPAYFARHGFLGVNINYRLAPAVTWPAATEDLGSAVAWLKANAAARGGDPWRIVVIGHSAGASIVASYALDHSIKTERSGVVGAVIISGPLGHGVERRPADKVYFGEDAAQEARHEPLGHVKESKLPLLITMAGFDPVVLAPDSHELAAAVCLRDGKCPPFLSLAGHNHISEIASIDTKDDRLGRAIVDFVMAVAKK
jgi:acetyl esterase